MTEVLALQGHVMLCTSRPAGVTEEKFKHFARLNMKPLNEEQQQSTEDPVVAALEHRVFALQQRKQQ